MGYEICDDKECRFCNSFKICDGHTSLLKMYNVRELFDVTHHLLNITENETELGQVELLHDIILTIMEGDYQMTLLKDMKSYQHYDSQCEQWGNRKEMLSKDFDSLCEQFPIIFGQIKENLVD